MFFLNEALYEYGIRSDVVRIAAGMIKVKKGTPLYFCTYLVMAVMDIVLLML